MTLRALRDMATGVKMSRLHFLGIILLCFANGSFGDVNLKRFVKLSTKQGDLRGVVVHARDGQEFVTFNGIPYAQPPIGELRWKPPLEAQSWNGVLDATQTSRMCLQDIVFNPSVVVGSEDCLHLNVYTKKGLKNDNGRLKKVMVWIHGGAFIFGGAYFYNPAYIMEEDIVMVAINYRLNIFGFLSAEDSDLPGNYGSLDQIEALRWVKKHIESYGGDPDDITLFGMSAGGASVHYLTMSPLARGLYKNAIALSGSALCWWANIPHPRENAIKLAKHFKCPDVESGLKIAECLRKIPADAIASVHHKLFFHWRNDKCEREPMNAFSPRSDPESENPFLPEPPIVAMELGHINPSPFMIGYTSKEGIWRANNLLPIGEGENSETWREFLVHFHSTASMAFGLHGGQTRDAGIILERLQEFYQLNDLAEESLTDEKLENIIDVLGDSMFNYAIEETAKLRSLHKEAGPTYLYYLSYSSKHTLARFSNNGTIRDQPREPLRQASHGADMMILFKFPEFEDFDEEDTSASRKFIKLLIEFARTGKPLPSSWEPLTESSPSYLHIGQDHTVEKGFPLSKRMDFWRSLPPVYWRHTHPVKRVEVSRKDEL